MKPARAWADEIFGCDIGTATIDDVRRIQADALRWAANISGVMHRTYVHKIADRLDRLASGTFTPADREADQKP